MAVDIEDEKATPSQKNLLQTIRPMLILSAALGLTYVRVYDDKPIVSKIFMYLQMSVTLLLNVAGVFILLHFDGLFTPIASMPSFLSLKYWSMFLYYLLVYVYVIYQNQVMINVLTQFAHIDQKLYIDNKKIRSITTRCMFSVISVSVLMLCFGCISYISLYHRYFDPVSYTLFIFFIIEIFLIPTTVEVLFLLFVNILNVILESYQANLDITLADTNCFMNSKSSRKLLKTISLQEDTKFVKYSDKIQQLRHLYDVISELRTAINRYFSLQLLLSFTNFFVEVIFIIFQAVFQFGNSHSSLFPDELKHTVIITCTYLLFLLVKICCIVEGCESVYSKDKRISVTVHRLYDNAFEKKARNEIHFFSSMLTHTNGKFSACEFFNIDRTLLQSIAGAVATYCVILIQFQMDSKGSSDENGITNATD